ncbi:MAG: hypothetical protein HQ528_07680 [Candidatus Marinimicrobia bacterium]|nr:hypothetical protein [Candidatus Neomarinimicrobiota bacterium]
MKATALHKEIVDYCKANTEPEKKLQSAEIFFPMFDPSVCWCEGGEGTKTKV